MKNKFYKFCKNQSYVVRHIVLKRRIFRYVRLWLRVAGMITDLYIDSFKFRGRNVRGRIQQLMEVLENYTLEALLEFFSSSAV